MSDDAPGLLRPRNVLLIVCALGAIWGVLHRAAPAIALAAGTGSLLLASRVWAGMVGRQIVARRDAVSRAHEDQAVDVRIEVGNRSVLPAVLPRVEDRFPADRVPRKVALVHPHLAGRTVYETTYQGLCDGRRGSYAIGPLTAVAGDPMGFFERSREIPLLQPLTVYPRTFDVGRVPRRGAGSRFDAASSSSAVAGSSMEFLGVREYRPGDEIRHVSWPQTARFGQLVVKEFEDATAADVAIVCDLHTRSRKGLGRISTVEYGVKIAASLVRHYHQAGHRVALFGEGKESLRVPMGRGDAHAAALLEKLTRARPEGDVVLPEVVARAADELERGALAFIVFSRLDVDLENYVEALTALRAKGVRVAAVLIDDGTFLGIYEDHAGRDPEATDSAVARFLAEGVPCYVVSAKDDLATRFRLPYLPDPRMAERWG